MRIVALAVALCFVMAPVASAKKRPAAPSHAKKSAKRAKKLVTVSKSRPTRVAAAAHVTSLPEVATSPPPSRVAPTAAAPVAAPVAAPPAAAPAPAPARALSPPVDRSHPAEQLSDDEVPGSRMKKR